MIKLAGAISLKEAADKAEERERQTREALEKGEAIANQHRPNQRAPLPFSSYISQQKGARYYDAENTPEDTEERWKQPETIAEVAEMLDFCEDSETLALIRLQSIPSEVFKIASRSLPREKREQIRQWVVSQNAA